MRITTFGCSFTSYDWPTWADIIGVGHDFENWGVAGLGNVGILNRMFHADMRGRLNDGLVITMWTTVNREDRSKEMTWRAAGNVFNNPYYDSDFLAKHWDDNDALNKTLMAMWSANKLSKANSFMFQNASLAGLKYIFDEYKGKSIFDYSPEFQPIMDKIKTHSWLKGVYEDEFEKEHRFPNNTVLRGGKRVFDHHPTPAQHLAWIGHKDYGLLQLLKPGAIELVEEYEELIKTENIETISSKWKNDPRNKSKQPTHKVIP